MLRLQRRKGVNWHPEYMEWQHTLTHAHTTLPPLLRKYYSPTNAYVMSRSPLPPGLASSYKRYTPLDIGNIRGIGNSDFHLLLEGRRKAPINGDFTLFFLLRAKGLCSPLPCFWKHPTQETALKSYPSSRRTSHPRMPDGNLPLSDHQIPTCVASNNKTKTSVFSLVRAEHGTKAQADVWLMLCLLLTCPTAAGPRRLNS